MSANRKNLNINVAGSSGQKPSNPTVSTLGSTLNNKQGQSINAGAASRTASSGAGAAAKSGYPTSKTGA